MAVASPLDNALALNPQGLDALRTLGSKGQTREAIKGAASQFEAYFMQMMLRSMRQTLSQDGPFDSQETRTFTDMFDQQIAQKVSRGTGLGLADMMLSQLDGVVPPTARQTTGVHTPGAAVEEIVAGPASAQISPAPAVPGSFVDQVWPHAVEAARSLGVSPHLLVAHAALETGWGRHELKAADGSSSHNMFNIKAGSGWEGRTVSREVTEYVNGQPVKTTEIFRAYDSPAESFADYARLLGTSPRYAGVLNQDAEGFISGLQQSGFATDPAYADKLRRVISGSALRQGLAG